MPGIDWLTCDPGDQCPEDQRPSSSMKEELVSLRGQVPPRRPLHVPVLKVWLLIALDWPLKLQVAHTYGGLIYSTHSLETLVYLIL